MARDDTGIGIVEAVARHGPLLSLRSAMVGPAAFRFILPSPRPTDARLTGSNP